MVTKRNCAKNPGLFNFFIFHFIYFLFLQSTVYTNCFHEQRNVCMYYLQSLIKIPWTFPFYLAKWVKSLHGWKNISLRLFCCNISHINLVRIKLPLCNFSRNFCLDFCCWNLHNFNDRSKCSLYQSRKVSYKIDM